MVMMRGTEEEGFRGGSLVSRFVPWILILNSHNIFDRQRSPADPRFHSHK